MGFVLHLKTLNAEHFAAHIDFRLFYTGNQSKRFLHFAKILKKAIRINEHDIIVIRIIKNDASNEFLIKC